MVHRFVFTGRLRFGRALLEEDRRQDDIGEHLKELALPVLHRCLEEAAARNVFAVAQRRLSMVGELLVLVLPADETEPDLKDEKQPEQRDRQPIVAKKCFQGPSRRLASRMMLRA